MSPNTEKKQKWALASVALQDAFTDFILSRQAILCSPATVSWYTWTLGKFMDHLAEHDIERPDEITARHVRAYLSQMAEQRLADSYVNNHARAIRTFCRFLHAEDYSPDVVQFQMPKIAKKKLPVLSEIELKKVLMACTTKRDKALVMFMVDSGVRRAELCALNWGDVDISSGLVRVWKGKGGKDRSVIIGAKTRRALIQYKIHSKVRNDNNMPLFQTQITDGRFSFPGLRSTLMRIGKRAGIHLSAHMLRRTFATFSLRSGMNLAHLSALLGHSNIDTTQIYLHLLDVDLESAHRAHGPIDNL